MHVFGFDCMCINVYKFPKMLEECVWSPEAGITCACVLSHIDAGNLI